MTVMAVTNLLWADMFCFSLKLTYERQARGVMSAGKREVNETEDGNKGSKYNMSCFFT